MNILPRSIFRWHSIAAFLIFSLSIGTNGTEAVEGRQAGSLDASFGDQGKVTLDFGGGWASATAVGMDGKVLVVGYNSGGSNSDFALARYGFDGQLDPTFGQNGRVVTDFNGQNDQALAVALNQNGKILVGGKTILFLSDPVLPDSDFALARYNPNGRLDMTFGLAGRVTLDFGVGDETAGIALQPDGKIIAAGKTLQKQGGQIALARLNSDGSLDQNFGEAGRVTTQIGQAPDVGAVLLQPDGKILVGGAALFIQGSQNGAFVARYLTDGNLDPSFGKSGIALLIDEGHWNRFNDLALQLDGKIVGVGTSIDSRYENILVARLKTDGTLDPGFGSEGKVVTDLGNAKEYAYGVQILSDGKILVAGHVGVPVSITVDFLLARYLPDGRADTTFGSQGYSRVDFGAEDYAYALALYGDGRAVVAGKTGESRYDFALARIKNEVPHFPPRVWFPFVSH